MMERVEWKCKGFRGYKNINVSTNFSNGMVRVPVGSPAYFLLEYYTNKQRLINRAFRNIETNEKRLTKLINK
jgi:hypothetical protein